MTTNKTTLANSDAPKYLATLIRGEFYSLKDHVFRPGEQHIVSEVEMVHLQLHAVDEVSTSDGEGMTKDKFEFEPYDGDKPVGYRFPTEGEEDEKARKVAQRERSRRIALAKAEPIAAPARTRTRARVA